MSIKDKIKRLGATSWKLVILEHGYDDLVGGKVIWIDGSKYPKKWFADPYILDYDDKNVYLLVEEFDFGNPSKKSNYGFGVGRIAKLRIDRSTWKIEDCIILLDLPTHLSFPVINRISGKIYVTPENNEGGGLDLYLYNNKTEKLEKIKRLVDKKLTDATPFPLNGKWYITTTEIPHPNGTHLDVYVSDSNTIEGPYRKVQTVSFPENIARNGGYPFVYKGRLMRAAQESNYSYGHSLSFQEISINADGTLSFKEVNRVFIKRNRFTLGNHTYNEYRGMGVTDVKVYNNLFKGCLLSLAYKLMYALHIKKRKRME